MPIFSLPYQDLALFPSKTVSAKYTFTCAVYFGFSKGTDLLLPGPDLLTQFMS